MKCEQNLGHLLVPLPFWQQGKKVRTTVWIPKKRDQRPVVEATGRPSNKCRLFVTDRDSKTKFLVDTGADVCVFPKKLVHGPRKSDEYKLFSVTDTLFCAYGLVILSLNLGLRREFRWAFIIATP